MSRVLVHYAKFSFCGRTIAPRGLIRDMRAWSTVYFADCRPMEFLVGTGPRSPKKFGNTAFLIVLPHNSHRHITVVLWPQKEILPGFWHSRSASRSHSELHRKLSQSLRCQSAARSS